MADPVVISFEPPGRLMSLNDREHFRPKPVWVYGDGSFECPHDTVVGWNSDGAHNLVAPPWENPCVPAGTRWPR